MQVFVVKFIGLIPVSLESSETVPPEVLVQIQTSAPEFYLAESSILSIRLSSFFPRNHFKLAWLVMVEGSIEALNFRINAS